MTHVPPAGTPPEGRDKGASILGLSTADLAGLSVDELVQNKTAITMVMHYYKQLTDENLALRNDVNTLKTYVDGYQAKRTNARIGAALALVGNVGIGFGVNLLTTKVTTPGMFTLIPGLIFAAVGLYFSLREKP